MCGQNVWFTTSNLFMLMVVSEESYSPSHAKSDPDLLPLKKKKKCWSGEGSMRAH